MKSFIIRMTLEALGMESLDFLDLSFHDPKTVQVGIF